ncbi:hypothetical protein GGR56DRAFT_491270 [Xylariaceae sp. FL0804]|nr:hypothetical protein GGR56DRAFT_491270 [Xylariaceae sp. FL0804]
MLISKTKKRVTPTERLQRYCHWAGPGIAVPIRLRVYLLLCGVAVESVHQDLYHRACGPSGLSSRTSLPISVAAQLAFECQHLAVQPKEDDRCRQGHSLGRKIVQPTAGRRQTQTQAQGSSWDMGWIWHFHAACTSYSSLLPSTSLGHTLSAAERACPRSRHYWHLVASILGHQSIIKRGLLRIRPTRSRTCSLTCGEREKRRRVLYELANSPAWRSRTSFLVPATQPRSHLPPFPMFCLGALLRSGVRALSTCMQVPAVLPLLSCPPSCPRPLPRTNGLKWDIGAFR